MLKFNNPLNTDVSRGDVPIGSAVGGGLVYGGPKYGDITPEKYDEYLKAGKVSIGQQAVELYGEKLLQQASRVYTKVGEYIPDLPGPNETVKKGLNIAKDTAGFAYDWTIKSGVETGMELLGLPVEVAHKVSKLQYEDGQVNFGGRGIGKAPLGIAETILTAGGPTALKGGKNLITKGDDIARLLSKTDDLAFATNGVLSEGVQAGLTNNNKPLVSNVFAAISKEGKASKTFKKWDKAARTFAEPRLKAGEKYPLQGFNKKFVDPKDGQIYTVGTYTSSKTGITKYVYKNKEGKAIATLNRNAARKLDEDTLKFQFSKYQSKYPDVDLVESYRKTNRKVYKAIEDELRELNAEGIEKFGKEWKELQVEHIHDVQHFAKLGKEAPRFKNKGADELWNLTIIPSDVNARTGAQQMSVNAGEAFTKATQNDTFIPYEQVTREFIDFDLADKVQKMTKADFTALTQMILKNPGENVHQLLSNYSLIK